MTKDEVVDLMLNSFNEDTRSMCLHLGMSEKETEEKIYESQASLIFLLSNAYDKLQKAGQLV